MGDPLDGCRLLQGTFAYAVQLLLGIIAVSSLVYKRYLEIPRRDWVTWFQDASKQAWGGLVLHFMNVMFSYFLQAFGNPCHWYLMNFMVDSLFGVPLNIILLLSTVKLGRKCGVTSLETGYYGHPPRWSQWGFQLCIWTLIIATVKIFLFFSILYPFKTALSDAGSLVMTPFRSHPQLELAVVMVIVPFVMNILIFWIQDSFLKKGNSQRNQIHSSQQSSESSDPYCRLSEMRSEVEIIRSLNEDVDNTPAGRQK